MNNKSQLESVIGQLQGQNSKDLTAQRAAIDKQIVDMIMKQTAMNVEDIVKGLSKRKTTAKPASATPNTAKKVGNVNTGFYADAVSASKPKLRTGDSAANIGAKIYAVIKQDNDDRKLRSELNKNREEEHFENEKTRHEELIKALKKAKGKPVVPPKGKKGPPARDEKGRFVKQEPAKPGAPTPAPKPAEAPKPAPKPAEAPKPAPKPAEAPKPAPKPAEAPKPAPKPAEAPTAKPAAEAPAAPTATKPPPSVPKGAGTAAKVISGGAKAGVAAALLAAGFSKAAQANIMANVDEESKFKPRSEEIGKYSAKTLFKMYGPPGAEGGQPTGGKNKVRFQSISDAQAIVAKGPEAIGDVIYGGRMGNTEPGDGFKYRGRGYIQLTGKDSYKTVGDKIGVDLVKNPDLANDPDIAAKIVPAFFQLKLGKNKPSDLDDIEKVNKIVGSASEESKTKRKQLATQYMNEVDSGSDLNKSSVENKDLKGANKGTNVVVDNTKTTVVSPNASPPQTIRSSTPSEKPAIIGG